MCTRLVHTMAQFKDWHSVIDSYISVKQNIHDLYACLEEINFERLFIVVKMIIGLRPVGEVLMVYPSVIVSDTIRDITRGFRKQNGITLLPEDLALFSNGVIYRSYYQPFNRTDNITMPLQLLYVGHPGYHIFSVSAYLFEGLKNPDPRLSSEQHAQKKRYLDANHGTAKGSYTIVNKIDENESADNWSIEITTGKGVRACKIVKGKHLLHKSKKNQYLACGKCDCIL